MLLQNGATELCIVVVRNMFSVIRCVEKIKPSLSAPHQDTHAQLRTHNQFVCLNHAGESQRKRKACAVAWWFFETLNEGGRG